LLKNGKNILIWSINLNRHNYFFLTAFAAVSVFGIYLRIQGISRGLDYDEIWTWCSYANKSLSVIFTDLTFPNNHPLHSLAITISTNLFGKTFLALRLPALLAGLCIPPVVGFLTWRMIRSKIASLLAFSICAFNVGLIYYSQTARGYSMQILFVLLAGFSLFAMRNSRTECRVAPFIFLLSASAAILTITSGIVFIIPLCLLWFLYNIEWHSLRKWFAGEWPFILSFFTFGVICLVWYGVNYTCLKSSQKGFGEDLYSPLLFFSFAGKMFWNISGILWVLVLLPLFTKEGRRNIGFCVLYMILVISSALFTKCGNSYFRIYYPLIPFIALGSASGLKILISWLSQKYKKLKYVACGILIFALAINANLSKWTPVDWAVVTPEIVKAFPKNVFINYDSNYTYSIWFHCRGFIMQDNFERIANFSGLFAQVATPGSVAGQDIVTECLVSLNVDPAYRLEKFMIEGVDIEIFHFRPIAKNDMLKDKIVLAMIGPTKDKEMYDRLIYGFFKPYKWLLLNPCLRANKQRFKDGLPGVEAFATNSCDAPASGLLELEGLSNGVVRFFIMENPK